MADKKMIVARAAKAVIMCYLYDTHSDWLEQRAKSELIVRPSLREPSKFSTFHDGFMAYQKVTDSAYLRTVANLSHLHWTLIVEALEVSVPTLFVAKHS